MFNNILQKIPGTRQFKEKEMENDLKIFLNSHGALQLKQQNNLGFGITDIETESNVYETKLFKDLHALYSAIGQVLCYSKHLRKMPVIVLDQVDFLKIKKNKPLIQIMLVNLGIRILKYDRETRLFTELCDDL